MRNLLALCLGLMLSGCWIGPQFYASSEAVKAIPAGTYNIVDVVDPTLTDYGTYYSDRVRVAYRPNGTVSITNDDGEGAESVIITPLTDVPGHDGIYVIQMDLGQGVAPVGTSVYGLLNIVDGGYQLALPKCDGTRRLRPGSRVIISGLLIGGRRCSFPDRASFEQEMRRFAQDPIRWTEYRRVS